MPTKQDIVDYLLERMSGVPDVTARKMFGEYAIYSTGKVVALVCDAQLFVKPSAAGREFIGTVTEGEPYPGAKPCFLVEEDRWDDGDWLSELIRVTAKALPPPKAKSGLARSAQASTVAKNRAKTKATAKTKTIKTETIEIKATKTKRAVKTPRKVKSKGGARSRA